MLYERLKKTVLTQAWKNCKIKGHFVSILKYLHCKSKNGNQNMYCGCVWGKKRSFSKHHTARVVLGLPKTISEKYILR